MAESQLFEVHRLAQAAHTKAQDAEHRAEKAIDAISAHEQICSERYDTINKSQVTMHNMLISMQASISGINNINSEARGTRKALTYMSLGIGILLAALKLAGH